MENNVFFISKDLNYVVCQSCENADDYGDGSSDFNGGTNCGECTDN